MTKKLAITFYYNVFNVRRYSGVQIHQSGVKAIDQIMGDAKSLFEMPVQYKNKPRIPASGQLTIGFAFRHLVARYLDDVECQIYRQYGDSTQFDPKTGRLVPPETKKASYRK
ncbi:hypothetical protein [uncultured Secundilactobacillus sp.]|uniref:hypothetical protein n=1 Tax=uncultured Secundilactobacillus sp. TaxID=2813935 RepID=UPI0025826469|nr:hypothetical protein [uncultured Secundilactobacillus sp.]